MKNPWNTEMTDSFFDIEIKNRIINYYNIMQATKPKNRENLTLDKEAYEYIEHKYIIEEYGYKTLVKCLGLTYTRVRTLLKYYLKIDVREGFNVVTDRVKKFRSERVKGDKNPWAYISTRPINSQISLQGYYVKKNGEKIWLRSSWEYIYAKWLEKNNIHFGVEVKRYKLSNNKFYAPDFFIYDEKKQLQYIVEIKGYQDKRMCKLELFRNEYPDIKFILITNILNYCFDYKGEVEQWRMCRLLKD